MPITPQDLTDIYESGTNKYPEMFQMGTWYYWQVAIIKQYHDLLEKTGIKISFVNRDPVFAEIDRDMFDFMHRTGTFEQNVVNQTGYEMEDVTLAGVVHDLCHYLADNKLRTEGHTLRAGFGVKGESHTFHMQATHFLSLPDVQKQFSYDAKLLVVQVYFSDIVLRNAMYDRTRRLSLVRRSHVVPVDLSIMNEWMEVLGLSPIVIPDGPATEPITIDPGGLIPTLYRPLY